MPKNEGDNKGNIIAILMIVVLAILVIEFGFQTLLIGRLTRANSNINMPTSENSSSSSAGHITITASGTASAIPTNATIDLNVEGMGKTSASAISMLSSELNKLNITIAPYLNENLSLIKTTSFSIYNESSYYSTYNGYVASEELSITVPQINNTSKVVGLVSEINNTSIYGISASLSGSQVSELRKAAFSMALSNATAQAVDLLGNVPLTQSNITVNSYNYYPIPYLANPISEQNSSATSTAPQYYKGTDTVTESITVVFSYPIK